MKTIQLKQLSIKNFKGLKSLTIDFNDETLIFGANASGKTSIFDAFTWLMFNKDCQGRTDFEVKTLNANNQTTDKQDVEVSAILLIDNEEVTLSKVLKEKWTKKRGSETEEFTGNEQMYWFNDVPVSQKEFQTKISNIVDVNIFKLITNPQAFVNLKWQDQRKALIEIAGIPSDRQIASGDLELENLLNEVGTQKTLEEYTVQTKSSIKKAKEEILSIPAIIEELTNSKPIPVVDKNITSQIENYKNQLTKLDEEISNKMKAFDEVVKARNNNQNEIQQLRSKINSIEFEVNEIAKQKANSKNPNQIELESKQRDFRNLQEEYSSLESKKARLVKIIETYAQRRTELREEWTQVNARKFELKPNDTTCGTCGQELQNSEALSSELEYKFNSKKTQELTEIQELGGDYKANQEASEVKLKTIEKDLLEQTTKIEVCDADIQKLKLALQNQPSFNADNFITESLVANTEYNELKEKISLLEAKTFETPGEELTATQKAKKVEIQNEIEKFQGYLKDADRIKEIDQRITELSTEEKTQNQNIATLERKLFLIEKFNKKKIDLLDENVNQLFTYVKFKLFEIQINGGFKETCEAMVNGVPYGNVNTAGRINTGLDIISTLCNYYKVTAPIFVDNAESTHTMIATNSQLIKLVVSPEDKILRVI
jgi:DNA repair exonuclease SbcCD ATPase subunit